MKSVFCLSRFIWVDPLNEQDNEAGYYELYRVFSTQEKVDKFKKDNPGTYRVEEFAVE